MSGIIFNSTSYFKITILYILNESERLIIRLTSNDWMDPRHEQSKNKTQKQKDKKNEKKNE